MLTGPVSGEKGSGLVGGKLEGSGCGKREAYLYDLEEKFSVAVLRPLFILFRFRQGLRVSIHRTVVSFCSASPKLPSRAHIRANACTQAPGSNKGTNWKNLDLSDH